MLLVLEACWVVEVVIGIACWVIEVHWTMKLLSFPYTLSLAFEPGDLLSAVLSSGHYLFYPT